MGIDLRGNPLSVSDKLIMRITEEAIRQYQRYQADPVVTIEQAIQKKADYVFGHVFKAMVLFMRAERCYVSLAKQSIRHAMAHIDKANERERTLLAVAQMLVSGQWRSAQSILDRLLVEYPTDIFAIQLAHQIDFYLGDSKNLRNRIARVMPHWHAQLPGYSFLLSCYAFGLEEMNQFKDAEQMADTALAMDPDDVWAMRAKAHVMEMQGRVDEGIEWLEANKNIWRQTHFIPASLHWQLALFYFDKAQFDRALNIVDEVLVSGSENILSINDVTSILWRLYLNDVDVKDRFTRIAQEWKKSLEMEAGFYAFNDVHAALAFAATGDTESIQRLIYVMRLAADQVTTNAMVTSQAGIALVEGIQAFAQGYYGEAIRQLEPARDDAQRMGGSHAQRDIITLTLIESALRLGDMRLAQHYISERTTLKEKSPLGWRLLNRARGVVTRLKRFAA